MGIIAFIILGAIAGAIAKALLPGDDPGGFIITTLVGIVGAILGGFLAAALFGADPMDEFWDLSSWLTAIVGSIVLLLIYRASPAAAARERSSDLAGRLEGEGLTAAREGSHGREPPAVLAPDVGEDAQRVGLDLVDVEAARLAAAVRPGLAEAGRDRDDDRVLAVRRRELELAPLGDVLWWMWPARIRSAPASTSPASTRFRFATGFFRERHGAPSR